MIRIAASLLIALSLSTTANAQHRPLMCFGNEPSWSIDLTEAGQARFGTPDGDSALYRGTENRRDYLGEAIWRGSNDDGGDLVVWLSDSTCSDNMSGTEHPVTARASLPDGRFLAGCCRLVGGPAAEQAASALEGPIWRLAEIAGAEPAGLRSLAGPVTLTFEDGRVHGFSGCNNFSGGYQLEDGRLQLSQQASTMMACPGAAQAVESAFQTAFTGSLEYSVDGERLLLNSASGQSLAFERVAPPQLAGSSWKVTGFNNNRQAVIGVMGDEDISLEFTAGEVSGSAGCNRFRASYTTDGDSITFGPAIATRMACADDLMEQEQLFLAALVSATSWRIDGNVLDMHRGDSQRAIWAISQ